MLNLKMKLGIFSTVMLFLVLNTGCQNDTTNLNKDNKTQQSTKVEQSTSVENKDTTNEMKGENSKGDKPNINSGLLLGLARQKEASKKLRPLERIPDEYRTLWIYHDGSKIDSKLTCIEKDNCIIAPFGDSFWKLGNSTFKRSEPNDKSGNENGDIFKKYNFYYNFFNIVSHPADKKLKDLYTEDSFKKQYIHGEGYMGEEFQAGGEWLSYVGNKYACVMDYYYGTGGGSYACVSNDIKMYEIGNLNGLEVRNKKMNLINLLDAQEKMKIEELSKKYNKTLVEGNLYSQKQVVEAKSLTLNRQNGRWQVQVPLFIESTHQGNGSSEKYITEYIDTDIKLPKSITSYDSLCIDWNTIKQKIPQAKDAVSSPDKDMLAVLTPKELLIFLNPEKGIESPTVSIPTKEDESIILNQWATGKYVEKWSNLISSY